MKRILYFKLILICTITYSQNYQINKIVVDKYTQIPLENVLIFNETDNSTTNSDGKFVFYSQKNEINLTLLGYNAFKTTFESLKNSSDTIFMESKTTQLQEVVVSNTVPYMKKVYSKLKENYLPNYTVNFFLRNVLKKDNTNIVLQDIYAKQNYNVNDKKKIDIEILNMRKTSFFEKKDHISLKFLNSNQFFDIKYPLVNKCNFTEVPFNDSDFKKILFESNVKDIWGQIWRGYYIIQRNDYTIVEYSLIAIDNPDDVPYNKLLLSSGKYRTVKYNRFVKFTKDVSSNKYYVSNSKLEHNIEVFVNKKTEKPFYYNLNLDFFVTNNPTLEKITPNFSADKDIFKAKFPYSKDFWNSQNQLPLTKELELFLKSVSEKKDNTKEFEVIGNF